MVFVVLGTQDKQFKRLLEDVDREISLGHIKEKVIVQAGHTKYNSENMEIFDFLSAPEFEKYLTKADLIITHGGAGTILSAVKKGKRIIACPRLEKHREHHNDHQKQIIDEFVKLGYILKYDEDSNLIDIIKESKKFKPKKFKSNTSNMINLIDNYIEDTDNTSWYNKYKEILFYLFFGGCTTLVNIITFMILINMDVNLYLSNLLAWIISVLFAFITNKLFVFNSRGKSFIHNLYELFMFFLCRVFSLFVDMGIIYLMIDLLNLNSLFSKITSNIVVIIINYFFSKILIFKK